MFQASGITEAARLRLLLDVDFFLSQHPEWNEYRLQIVAGMDWKFLKRVRAGESFSTRAGDKLLQAMERLEREGKRKPKGKTDERRERKRSVRGGAEPQQAEASGPQGQGQGESTG